MAPRRRGSIVARGSNTWLVRVFAGSDLSTGKRRYRTATVHGTEAQADRRLAEMEHEVNVSLALASAGTVRPRPWLAPLLGRAQPALGPVLASAASLAAPLGPLAVAAAAGMAGAGLALWQQAQLERFLEAFEERMVCFVGQVVDDKWAEALSQDAAEVVLQAMARAHLIVGPEKLAAIAALVAGACVGDRSHGVPSTDLLEIAAQLSDGDVRVFAALVRVWRVRRVARTVGVRLLLGELATDSKVGHVAVQAHCGRLEAQGLVVRPEDSADAFSRSLGEPFVVTDFGWRLVDLAEAGGWLVASADPAAQDAPTR